MKLKRSNIKIPEEIVSDQWQIPVPENADEHEYRAMKNYKAYETYLTNYGFEKIYETQSLLHKSLEHATVSNQPNTYAMWHHPKGVFAMTASHYNTRFTPSRGGNVPYPKELGWIKIHAMIDVGTGLELQQRANYLINGDGFIDPQANGLEVRNVSGDFLAGEAKVADFLGNIQKHGQLIPLAQWGSLRTKTIIGIDSEFLLPISERPDTPEKIKDIRIRTHQTATWKALMNKLPEDIALVLNLGATDPKDRRSIEQLLYISPVKEALNIYSEALFFAKKRWQGSFDEKLLERWTKVACGVKDFPFTQWRAYESGPAGLSLATTLIHSTDTTDSDKKLIKLLREAPQDVLHTWATSPDASGYTLGLHVVLRLFQPLLDSTWKPVDGLAVDVLSILHERLGREGVVMATKTRSLLGIAMQFDDSKYLPPQKYTMRNNLESHQSFLEVVEWLDTHGIEWNQHLRGRNYPNIMMEEDDKPSFFRGDGPVDEEQWKALLGKRYTSNLDGVMSLLRLKNLKSIMDASHQNNSTTLRTSRVKL